MFLALCILAAACSGGASDPSRDATRGMVLVVADAVKVADGICASLALAKKDPKLAKVCADAYDIARPSLLAAESGIDLYDGKGGPLLCSVGTAVEALAHVAEAISAAGASLPAVVADALSLAKGLRCAS